MYPKLKQAIDLLSKELSDNFSDFEGAYLFGLFADGKWHEGEDIELVIIFSSEDSSKSQDKIWPIVGKVETSLDVCLDIYPYTKDKLEADEEFYAEIINEAIYFPSN